MPITISRGATDSTLDRIAEALQDYQGEHPSAQIDLYRLNQVSIRARIIDEHFRGMTRGERNKLVWTYFDRLSEEEQSDITMLVLITPEEVAKSFANIEFEDPVPGVL